MYNVFSPTEDKLEEMCWNERDSVSTNGRYMACMHDDDINKWNINKNK